MKSNTINNNGPIDKPKESYMTPQQRVEYLEHLIQETIPEKALIWKTEKWSYKMAFDWIGENLSNNG